MQLESATTADSSSLTVAKSYTIIVGRPTTPLVIAPNLDALLAADEQNRQRAVSLSPRSPLLPGSPHTPGGLPPPPRARNVKYSRSRPVPGPSPVDNIQRGSRLPSADETTATSDYNLYSDTHVQERDHLSAFLNPTPALETQLRPLAFPTTDPDYEGELETTPPLDYQRLDEGGDSSPHSSSSPSTSTLSDNTPQRARSISRHQYLPSFSRIDKMLGKAKAALAGSEEREERTSVDRSFTDQSSRSPSRIRHTSHSRSSSFSQYTTDSSPQAQPSAEVEQRISISSTIYPASRPHSVDDNLYRPVSFIASPMSATSHDIHSPSADSFLDIASPSSATTQRKFYHRSPPMSPITFAPPPISTTHDDTDTRTTSIPALPLSLAPKMPAAIKTLSLPDYIPIVRPRSTDPSASRPFVPAPGTVGFEGPVAVGRQPSTTNLLDSRERAERIRRTQKLTQLFGRTPDPDALAARPVAAAAAASAARTRLLGLGARKGHSRGAVSVSATNAVAGNSATGPPILPELRHQVAWPPPDGTQYMNASGRRHSTPLSPDDFIFLRDKPASSRESAGAVIEVGSAEGVPQLDDGRSIRFFASDCGEVGPDSPRSFMDLSDEDAAREDDDISLFTCDDQHRPRNPSSLRSSLLASPSTPSLAEKLSEIDAEEDRRKKREKLARLHRFLGSRVPADLVLGPENSGAPLPPLAEPNSTTDPGALSDSEGERRRNWMRRRRSSSAATPPARWSDEVDRIREDLSEREKAVNVRRAMKMEKVFGVAPPQTLYHTRQALPALGPSTPTSPIRSPPMSPPMSPVSPPRNPNQSAYNKLRSKSRGKKPQRPGTSDSNDSGMGLLSNRGSELRRADSHESELGLSEVYVYYRNSLNSLKDIIDRDDQQSLAELRDYLNSDDPLPPPSLAAAFYGLPVEDTTPLEPGLVSPTTKSERRHSLPLRSSMTSMRSEISVVAPRPDVTAFQVRRRRAAKLTNFFGESYRDLVGDILESIQKGVEDECVKGNLDREQMQDLLRNVQTIRKRQGSIS